MAGARSGRKLLKPRVTGQPIYYRTRRGGSWQLSEFDLLYALDQYFDGELIRDICEHFGISSYVLYKNIGPYLERRVD
jgi:hypothetical protein